MNMLATSGIGSPPLPAASQWHLWTRIGSTTDKFHQRAATIGLLPRYKAGSLDPACVANSPPPVERTTDRFPLPFLPLQFHHHHHHHHLKNNSNHHHHHNGLHLFFCFPGRPCSLNYRARRLRADRLCTADEPLLQPRHRLHGRRTCRLWPVRPASQQGQLADVPGRARLRAVSQPPQRPEPQHLHDKSQGSE